MAAPLDISARALGLTPEQWAKQFFQYPHYSGDCEMTLNLKAGDMVHINGFPVALKADVEAECGMDPRDPQYAPGCPHQDGSVSEGG